MEIIKINNNDNYLKEYIILCNEEWGRKKSKEQLKKYIEEKIKKIHSDSKVISILALIHNEKMIGFISLFKYDGEKRKNLTPWYATMYVKKEYRNRGYSKLLNKAILKEAKNLGYKKVYLKTTLNNYYEKFGAKFYSTLDNKEKIYYIEIE